MKAQLKPKLYIYIYVEINFYRLWGRRKIPLRVSTRHPDGTRRLGGLGISGEY